METKPGIKTTEFWLTLVAGLAPVVAAMADKLPPKYATLASTLAVGLYALSRGHAKNGVKPDA